MCVTNSGITLKQVAGSIDELAQAMHAGFSSVERALATKADKEDIVRLEGRVVRLEEGVTRLDGRVARLEEKVERLDGDVTRLDGKIDDLHEEVMGFASDVYDELSGRVAILERKKP